MSSEWPIERLGDLCSKIGSGATPRGGKSGYLDTGIALIRSQNVLDGDFSWDGLARISDDAAAKLASVTVQPDDVLLNITGDSVARACRVAPLALPARVNQHVAILRPSDSLDPDFLGYWLISPAIKAHLLQLASAGATRNALTKSMIEELEIAVPPLDEQQRIAGVLRALDRKIANNQSTARHCLEVAIHVTRSELRALETSPVPLSEVLTRHRVRAEDTTAPYIGLDQMPQGSPLLDAWITENAPTGQSHEFLAGDLLFGKLRPYFAKAGPSLVAGRCSTEILVLRPTAPNLYGVALSALTDRRFIEHCVGVSSGTRMPRSEWKDASSFLVDVPNDTGSLDQLAATVRTAVAMTEQLVAESRRLGAIRDALLPRLVTGDLNVSDAYNPAATAALVG